MIKLYICGPTVYNNPHIGNLRAIVTFDLILKAMRFLKKDFCLVHNITDIDDKIINKAIESNKTEKEISEKYTAVYFDLLKMLNVDTITCVEKVTDNMDVITKYIQRLIDTGNAYSDSEGNVWFDVKKNADSYGSVSGQKIEKMAFEEQNINKKFPADFALWKNTKVGIKYDSPFGQGRPGWHTECCALIDKHFSSQGVDIHSGGMDLTFPHHENENIQHFALHNKHLASEWLRTGQINLEGVKMSKSLGNVISPEEFFNKYGVEIYKLMILTAKFSAPINITEELFKNLKSVESKYIKVIFQIFLNHGNNFGQSSASEESIKIFEALANYDFAKYNMLLNEEIKKYNKYKSYEVAQTIITVLNILHPTLTNYKNYLESIKLFDEWRSFVEKKDYLNADICREKLMKTGHY
ncbi:class I tRNA ligase family protein [Mycoplasma zalophidermidis]|uniref:Class I tRNA ligase family protein n=1 Tax=Mycoplasma zalophidermidis TaxID=398174 RepID=A0ABS6DR54_9MOLU|nr:class I tRNA ligase family protein [Mycoplasma zalophidermidis]MBU4689577.1 class I tRNA ligase family protein [Mycoplasma zalophidermidis]MBU4693474.1 class I tRNA ligase family protein [Mycoplasma zalophidermidis]MCR8966244.1 class I tRNA ligase family protein [Mycoplasma zalophidermidis]